MPERKDEARGRYVRGESFRQIAATLGAEETQVRRWAEDGQWDVVRAAVVLEVAALRAVEAEAADDRYAAVSDAIRGMASALIAKIKSTGSAKGAELLALTRTIAAALELREQVERRRANRKHRRE